MYSQLPSLAARCLLNTCSVTGGELGPRGATVTSTQLKPCPHRAGIPRTREAGWKLKVLTKERKSLTEGCMDTLRHFPMNGEKRWRNRKQRKGLGGPNILEVPGRDKQEWSKKSIHEKYFNHFPHLNS